ncbi:MAG: GAF domain-containing sensor histidine kinase [bacterium]|nr:GAF domain-containing sensor histidine kinase [bacterium]
MSKPSQLQQRTRELTILNAIAGELNGSADLTQILQTALSQVAALLDLDTSWIWLMAEDTGESYLAASQNLPPALAQNPASMEGWCYCLDTYEKGDLKGAANVNVVTCSRLKDLIEGTEGLLYHASIPLYGQNHIKIGVLNVASTTWRKLSVEDLRLLNTVGDLLSIAIERARLFDKSVHVGAVEERYRLARELHDTLGQGLTAILLKLETLDALLDVGGDPEAMHQAVHDTIALTRTNLEEARRSVQDLRAAPLKGQTLAGALETLAKETTTRENLTVHFEATGTGRPLPVRIESGLYRIAQEALNNIIQHAEANTVSFHLSATPRKIRLRVQDDGCGFDPEQIPDDRFGLVGLNERARLLEGQLKLESSPDQGTRIEVIIPLEATP